MHHSQTPSPTDLQLVEAWRRGDARASATLFDRYYRSVRRFFDNRVCEEDSPDLTQATFLACLECLARFRGDASFRCLLFAIARNVLKRHYRATKRARRPLDPELMTQAPPMPFAALAHLCESQRLREALARLPEDTRRMLDCYYWEAMGVREVAAHLGVSEGAVKTRMRRARMRLAQEVSGPSTPRPHARDAHASASSPPR